jgi:nicotinamide mononucleotide transporter
MSHQLLMKVSQRSEALFEAVLALVVAAVIASVYYFVSDAMGVPPSRAEFFGTWLNIACVYLCARDNIWNWPIGIVAVLFFGYAFFFQKLYASMFMNLGFYFLIQFHGWWLWSKGTIVDNLKPIRTMHLGEWVVTIASVAFVALVWGMFFTTYTDAIFAQLDALILGLSVAAQVLMNGKRLESWCLWILVDVISTYVYIASGLVMIGALYFCFIFLASYGLWHWYREFNGQKVQTAKV